MIRAVAKMTCSYRFNSLYASLDMERLKLLPEAEQHSVSFLTPSLWINTFVTGIVVSGRRTLVSLAATALSPLLLAFDIFCAVNATICRSQYAASAVVIIPLTAYTTIKSAVQCVGYTLALALTPVVVVAGVGYIVGSLAVESFANFLNSAF